MIKYYKTSVGFVAQLHTESKAFINTVGLGTSGFLNITGKCRSSFKGAIQSLRTERANAILKHEKKISELELEIAIARMLIKTIKEASDEADPAEYFVEASVNR